MNFFEQELHRIVAPKYPDATYVGRACYVRLNELNRAKIQFVTGIVANQYHALRISILNRNEGQVDAPPTSGMTTGKRTGMSTIPTAGTTGSSRRRFPTTWRYFRSRPRRLTLSGSRPCK